MYVTGLNTIGSTSNQTSTSSNSSISMEDFYTLLSAELQNQDPTDPVDNDTLIQQTAAYSQLERLDTISQNIEDMLLYQQSINNSQAVSFIGKTVTAESDQLTITDGASGAVNFNLEGDATETKISIYNSDGTLVREIDGGPLSEGENSIDWDCRDSDGNVLSDGAYTFSVSAVDESGAAVSSTTMITSEVLGVTFENGISYLQLENCTVPLGNVTEVYDS